MTDVQGGDLSARKKGFSKLLVLARLLLALKRPTYLSSKIGRAQIGLTPI